VLIISLLWTQTAAQLPLDGDKTPSANDAVHQCTTSTATLHSNLSSPVVEVILKVHSAYLCSFLHCFDGVVPFAVATEMTNIGVVCMRSDNTYSADITAGEGNRKWYKLNAPSCTVEFLLKYSVVTLSAAVRQAFDTTDTHVVVHIAKYVDELSFPSFKCWRGCPFCDGVYRPPITTISSDITALSVPMPSCSATINMMTWQNADCDASFLDSDEEPWNAFKMTNTTEAQSPQRVKRTHSSTPHTDMHPPTPAGPLHEEYDSTKRVKNDSPMHNVPKHSNC